jgi:hypothetical protein
MKAHGRDSQAMIFNDLADLPQPRLGDVLRIDFTARVDFYGRGAQPGGSGNRLAEGETEAGKLNGDFEFRHEWILRVVATAGRAFLAATLSGR